MAAKIWYNIRPMEKKVDLVGLTDQEVLASRAKFGANVLTPPKKESLWKKFLAKFSDPLIIILLVALGLSASISLYEYFVLEEGFGVFFEPLGIFAAVMLATGCAFIFEVRAGKAFDLLNQVNDEEAVEVVRNGARQNVPRRDVVVGDIVQLATGNEIPADGELLEAVSLGVDESSLTGEPICHKTTNKEEFDAEATFPSNRVLRGTKVMEGHGVMRVEAVGDATENGKVFEASRIDSGEKTPLDEQLAGLAKVISRVSYVLAGLVLVGRFVSYFGMHPGDVWAATSWAHVVTYMLDSLMIAVTLVVVSVPEGLPMAVTLSLAYSMHRMFQAKFLVRKLHACETMGATTVICTDKTGTLTQNQMRVQATEFAALGDEQKLGADEVSGLIAEGIAVNSTASLNTQNSAAVEVLGNPTEGALLLWLRGQGKDYEALRAAPEKEDEVPFSTERKYMASVVKSGARHILYVKGAPEIVMGFCEDARGSFEALKEKLQGYQKRALRTLAFAYCELKAGEAAPIDEKGITRKDLVFLGFVAIADPVRGDVPGAMRSCLNAGIGVKVVTGDTPNTAKEIARQIGLWTDGDTDEALITGPEFAALTEEELDARVGKLKVIARSRPMDKKRLVEALKKAGAVVAVTGDGTNDAPALKAAHVGLSMGDGTSVAKEASDVTILDNSFASIVRAIMWGRSLYRNIQRFILFQTTVNIVACLTVLIGAFFGTKSPLTVTQMLWVNLIMDTFAAMAMASLPPNPSVLKEPPRKREAFIITRSMCGDLVLVGVLFTALLMGLLVVFERFDVTSLAAVFAGGWEKSAAPSLTPYELSVFFTAFVLLQFWNLFRVRTLRGTLSLKGCGVFCVIALVILFGQVILVTFGGRLFDVVALSVVDWGILLGATLVPLLFASIKVPTSQRGKNMV